MFTMVLLMIGMVYCCYDPLASTDQEMVYNIDTFLLILATDFDIQLFVSGGGQRCGGLCEVLTLGFAC